jgi:hypothetical protein
VTICQFANTSTRVERDQITSVFIERHEIVDEQALYEYDMDRNVGERVTIVEDVSLAPSLTQYAMNAVLM